MRQSDAINVLYTVKFILHIEYAKYELCYKPNYLPHSPNRLQNSRGLLVVILRIFKSYLHAIAIKSHSNSPPKISMGLFYQCIETEHWYRVYIKRRNQSWNLIGRPQLRGSLIKYEFKPQQRNACTI